MCKSLNQKYSNGSSSLLNLLLFLLNLARLSLILLLMLSIKCVCDLPGATLCSFDIPILANISE